MQAASEQCERVLPDRNGLNLQELEPRILYSGSPIPMDAVEASQMPDGERAGSETDGVWLFDESSTNQINASDLRPRELETRAMLVGVAALTVDTTADVVDGDVSSIAALEADRGGDGFISLREAILATNNTPNGTVPDHIGFAIDDADPGRLYYADDGIADSLSLVQSTIVSDSSITDYDPDYAHTPHSWFRIALDGSLPDLRITDGLAIDGYSQDGASVNARTLGQDAVIRIEISGDTAVGTKGLVFSATADNSTVQGLAINGFDDIGILAEQGADSLTVRGNFIGTDVTGVLNLGNGNSAIWIAGTNAVVGGGVEDRNVLSGNGGDGVTFVTAGMISGGTVENNYIGIDATGLTALGNQGFGIKLFNTSGVGILNNVIADNDLDGIRAETGSVVNNTVIRGNLIGTDAPGTMELGNGGSGVRFSADSAVGNQIGGAFAADGNVIGGSDFHGIVLDGTSVTATSIYGNSIGTDATGTFDFGNELSGILIATSAQFNQIGGDLPGQGNTVTNNGRAGVTTLDNGGSGSGNSIRGNRIFNNDGLGIDLDNDGVTVNDIEDIDTGINRLQNFPVITSALTNGNTITIEGDLVGEANTDYVIDFYGSTQVDGSGHGEAAVYLGSVVAPTTDAAGATRFAGTPNARGIVDGQFVTVTATHADGSTSEFSVSQVVTIPNSAPVLNAYQITLNEGETVELSTANFNATDANDPDPQLRFELSNIAGGFFALKNNPTVAINSFLQLQIDSGQVLFVDDGNELPPAFDIEVTDGILSDGPRAGNVAFTEVNDAPQKSVNLVFARAENQPVFSINLIQGARDAENDPLSVVFSVTPTNDTSGIAVAGNTLTVNPGAYNSMGLGESISFVYVYDIVDGNGGAVEQTLTITVLGENDAPTVSQEVTADSDEGTGQLTVNLLEYADDVDNGNVLTVVPVFGNTPGVMLVGNELVVDTNETRFNDLAVGDSETIVYPYRIDDGLGGSVMQTARVTIHGTNDAPIATDDEATTDEDQSVTVDVLANDTDPDRNTRLTVSIPVGGQPANGVATINADNTINYTPAANFDGTDQLTYTINDDQGGVRQAVVNLTVNGSNDLPVVERPFDPLNVVEDAPVYLIDLTEIFDDADGESLSFDIISNSDPSLVNATIVGNQLELDFLEDRFGLSDVTVSATDSGGGSIASILAVTVSPVNDLPVVASRIYSIESDRSTISGNLLDGASDIEGDPLSATLVKPPESGSLLLDSNGTFEFVPAEGFFGTVTAQFLVTDGSAGSTTGIATFVVAPVPIVVSPPVTNDGGDDDEDGDEDDDEEKVLAPIASYPDPIASVASTSTPVIMVGSRANDVYRLEEDPDSLTVIADLGEVRFRRGYLVPEMFEAPVEVFEQRSDETESSSPATELFASLDLLSDDLDSASRDLKFGELTTTVSLSGVAIGFVTMILRSAGLMASMLANLPAWRMVDPLVVLGHREDEEEESDESLLDIVDDSGRADQPEWGDQFNRSPGNEAKSIKTHYEYLIPASPPVTTATEISP